MKETTTHIFFWGGVFSNWHPCEFVWRDIKFNCSEQAMMWTKADLFQDELMAWHILNEKNPRKQKEYGKKVEGYNDRLWSEKRFDIAVDFLTAKFYQNLDLKKELLSTGNKIIVEASPFDRIWGIGLREDNPLCLDESKWRGENLQGKALVVVRDLP